MILKVCGIDIGSFSVKVARLEVQNRSLALTQFHEYPLSLDPTRDRQIELIEILRAIRAQDGGSNDTRYVIALSQLLVASRLKTFPFKERLKILRATPFEVEDDIPLDQDDAIFDAKIARFKGSSADVICMAAPKEEIGNMLVALRDSGIDPSIISCEASAYANCVEDWASVPPQYSVSDEFNTDVNSPDVGLASAADVYLHFGHTSTVLTVFQNGRMVSCRGIQWGGKAIVDTIAFKLQTPAVSAAKLLQTKGYIALQNNTSVNKDQMAMSELITESLRQFVYELRLSLLELRTDFNIPVSQIYLTGGVSQIPNLGPYLTQMTEVSVNRYNYLEKYPNWYVDPGGPVPTISNIAVGLAVEAAKKPRNPAINFRKGEFAGEGQNWQMIWKKWKHIAQLSACLFAIILVYSILRENFAIYASKQAEVTLKDQAKKLAGLKGAAASESKIRQFVNGKEKEGKVREMLDEIKGLSSALDVLKKFSDSVPRKDQVQVDLRQWSLQRDQLFVEGFVGAPAQVEILRRALSALAADSSVQAIPIKTPTPNGKTSFAFKLKVQRQQSR